MKILAEVTLRREGIWINGHNVIHFNTEHWLKEAYQLLAMEYPKFYKMDTLSKMAMICVEHLKKQVNTNWWVNEDLPQVIANKNASVHTDLQFEASYQEGKSPSPSLFVYTLPNIVTGELAIRNKWYGQNWFFVLEHLDWTFLEQQIIINLFDYKGVVVCGWTDIGHTTDGASATFRLLEHK